MLIILVTSWIAVLCPILYLVVSSSRLSYCASRDIPNFYCEHLPTFHLACGDISETKKTTSFITICILFGPLSFIFVSYIALIAAVIKIANAESQRKAFSTCISHLFLVLMFYIPVITTFMFCFVGTSFTNPSRKFGVLLCSTLPPMLNPIIYSLKTEEIWGRISRVIKSQKMHPMSTSPLK
nr:PREDICTED: olfactory receptor 13-like [Latimeria chalumnae]|eukprot:XP_006008078.2 PREDICTED: olfactory receptor 13-like [Latimeria chalumnae]